MVIIQSPLDNKTCPLIVPGLGKIPIDGLLPCDQFAKGIEGWRAPILTAKELAMLDLINTITDRLNWHHDIFDQEVITQWREDAVKPSPSLINEKTWDWCLQELQDKARQFDRDGSLVVFNTMSGICKSDTAISSERRSQLSRSIDILYSQVIQQGPFSPVVNVVDPSLFPLVYGRTKILVEGQACGMDEDFWSSCIKEHPIIPSPTPILVDERSPWYPYIWSSKFQWLPCEVEFTGPPGSTTVRISSYINNLHPTNHELYSVIEEVVSSSIKQWNKILVRGTWKKNTCHYIPCSREPMRIRTYGVDWKAEFPEWAKKLPKKEDESKLSVEQYEAMCAQVEEYLQEPESRDDVYWDQVRTQKIPKNWRDCWGLLRTALTKYAHTFVFEHSDPGTAYSYEDWKAGKTGKAIVGPANQDYVCSPDYELSKFFEANPWLTPYEWKYTPKAKDADDHQFYESALENEFREQGLQIFVRIHSIELNPDTPSFPGEEWHTEGNSNERIVANTIYMLDSENMIEPQISFRQNCSLGNATWVYDRIGAVDSEDEDDNIALNLKRCLWDLKYMGKLFGYQNIRSHPAWQQLGEVKMSPGRLISFPNSFQCRMSPLQLRDNTKAGHCRFLTISVVDPNYRLCSTRNVPPQQSDWIKGDAAEFATQMDSKEAFRLRDELAKEHVDKDERFFRLGSTLTFPGFW
ncbi:hypothetical protein PENSTE_c011G01232 [Penicillium steckii]|uniref:Uncharacterized protein n=1 Tax=Penicillium steckii TaxID=303698 RepID=A0A1V6T7H8_9EURO|nr:hypothetical protein PENSTE_c011G01232 [Penicillium steckii]